MFYVLFVIILIIAMYIIWHTCKRYNLYSNGYYKNGGQDIVLWCEKSQKDIISILNDKNANDTLNYDFFQEGETYYFKAWGIRRLQERSCFPVLFQIKFTSRENGIYITASLAKRVQIIYSGTFEPELYEFFEKKLGCIPKEKIV